MAGGEVNLLRIMRDILVLRPTKHPRLLLPYPVFISRIATRHELPEFPNDKFHIIRSIYMYVPYGDWRGERARTPARQRRQPLLPLLSADHETFREARTSASPTGSPDRQHVAHDPPSLPRYSFEGLISDDSSESQEF
ncbi:hypothetical protein PIB30_048995 [Stylosanthes scabra]|uniref:Uncharacterized protein n=1 Tax=Stylosanthes scabra TaxID=79078 RepID=A0ABU6YG04_9FABA|nr:hypothetical protein [Stylosanthes scabra]